MFLAKAAIDKVFIMKYCKMDKVMTSVRKYLIKDYIKAVFDTYV